MKKAYFIENNLRIREIEIVRENASSCVVRTDDGKGLNLNKSRIYYNLDDAIHAIRKKRPDVSLESILPPSLKSYRDTNAIFNGL